MKKKMALLLVIAMVVTTSITVPFVSFADDAVSTAKEITAIYGEEDIVKAPATKSTDLIGSKVIYSAEYTYTSKWKSAIVLSANKENNADQTIKVTAENGTSVEPVDNVYKLAQGGKYAITLEYAYKTKNKPKTDPTELSLKVKAFTSKLTPGTNAELRPIELINIENEELWYEVTVDNAKGKGVIFSLLSGDTAKNNTGYSARIYSGKTSQGVASWNADYEMMFESPLYLESGKYYVKVYPTTTAETVANLKLTATMISANEIDSEEYTPATIKEGETGENLSLYSFQNLDDSYYWYKIQTTTPITNTARYELNIDYGTSEYGDVVIELNELVNQHGMRHIINENDGYTYAGSDSNKFYVDFKANSKYYLRLRPIGDMPRTDINVSLKKHDCDVHWFVSDADCQEISYGCPCGAEDSIKASCILEAEFANITYSGEEMMLDPTLTFSDWYPEDGEISTSRPFGCYTVSYKNSKGEPVATLKNIGKYTATIEFCKSIDPNSNDSLEGLESITKTIKVVPVGTTLKSVTAAKKAFTVKWNKQTVKTTGYQIQYSTSSKFTKAKTVTISKNTTASKKITKLSAKKKYYVRVRTYRTVSGTKYYSAWSAKKSVTTKK